MTQREKLIEILSQYFTIGDSDEYSLLRDKSAFAIGTMSLEDFVEFDDEKVADITDYLLANGVVVLPCNVDAPLYYIGRRLKHGELSNEYVICEGKAEAIEFDSDGWVVFDEHGSYFSQNAANVPYFTREEAEAALKKMEGEK